MLPLPPAKDILVLMTGTCKYVNLLSKKIFCICDQIKDLERGRTSYSVGPSYIITLVLIEEHKRIREGTEIL